MYECKIYQEGLPIIASMNQKMTSGESCSSQKPISALNLQLQPSHLEKLDQIGLQNEQWRVKGYLMNIIFNKSLAYFNPIFLEKGVDI